MKNDNRTVRFIQSKSFEEIDNNVNTDNNGTTNMSNNNTKCHHN